jgi:cell wall assembly regulator SMI1
MPVGDVWNRVEAWLSLHAPDIRESLLPPVGAGAVQDLEEVVKLALPTAFKTSLALHDGQDDRAPSGLFPYSTILGPAPAWRLLSVEEIDREWQMLAELSDGGDFKGNKASPATGVRPDWWNKGWLPIAGDGGGDSVCIDLSPATGGSIGQIIIFHHDDGDRPVLASSFESWLTELAGNLEAGRYRYEQGKRGKNLEAV